MSSRPSTSSIKSESIPNVYISNFLKIKYVRLDQRIPNIIYEENLPDSPTQTEMDTSSQLNVIILESKFELDKNPYKRNLCLKQIIKKKLPF